MRWDIQELRKSHLETTEKARAKGLEQDLVQRVSEVFSDEQVRAPQGYLNIIRSACAVDGLNLASDDAERIWRAASGAAHGKYWPIAELQRVIPVPDNEPGQHRSVQIPDVDGMTEALRAAYDMTQIGVLRYLDYSGLDIQALLSSARTWIREVIPLKDGIDREEVRRRLSQFPDGADT